MENKLNPLQIFQSKGVANKFLPSDFNMQNVLFWRVPELLEENYENEPAYKVTPGENGNKHEFYQKRSDASKEYIKQSMLDSVYEKMSADPQALVEGRHKDFYMKIYKLLENSGGGRIGAHLAGLYVDCSKIPALFEMPFDEAERIVDNNLVLANVACIYSAFAENHDKELCEEVKTLFKTTLNLITKPKVHLKPVFCVASKENGKIVSRTYVEDRPNIKLKENEKKITLQADLVDQFNAVARKEQPKLRPTEMFWFQQMSVRNAEQQEKMREAKQKSTSFGE